MKRALVIATVAALTGCGGKTVIKTTTVIREVTVTPVPTPKRIGVARSKGAPVFCLRQVTQCWQEDREVNPPRETSICGQQSGTDLIWYGHEVTVPGQDDVPSYVGYVFFCDFMGD